MTVRQRRRADSAFAGPFWYERLGIRRTKTRHSPDLFLPSRLFVLALRSQALQTMDGRYKAFFKSYC